MKIDSTFQELPSGKKLYFASDFHLGAPDDHSSLARERKIIEWLNKVEKDAAGIFLVGDIFDFWFEYKHVIPKGFIRFQGKLADLTDKNIPIIFFTGNHDMWMFDYFSKELGIKIFRNPIRFQVGRKKLFVGHGDGLGPGDNTYKFLKLFFDSKLCQWLFKWLHPTVGMGIAKLWSAKSRISNSDKDVAFQGDKEWLIEYLRQVEEKQHNEVYIFGHRHIPVDIVVGNSQYINLGEWVTHMTYAEFDGESIKLKYFKS